MIVWNSWEARVNKLTVWVVWKDVSSHKSSFDIHAYCYIHIPWCGSIEQHLSIVCYVLQGTIRCVGWVSSSAASTAPLTCLFAITVAICLSMYTMSKWVFEIFQCTWSLLVQGFSWNSILLWNEAVSVSRYLSTKANKRGSILKCPFSFCFSVLSVSLSVHSLGRRCQWLPAWRLCQSATRTRRQPAPSSTPLCPETRTLLLPSGAAIRITHRQDRQLHFIAFCLCFKFFFLQVSSVTAEYTVKLKSKGKMISLQC